MLNNFEPNNTVVPRLRMIVIDMFARIFTNRPSPIIVNIQSVITTRHRKLRTDQQSSSCWNVTRIQLMPSHS